MKKKINSFIASKSNYPILTVFAAGLYPFLHYFNSNLHIANSWKQLVFMIMLCFLLPQLLSWLSTYVFRLNVLKRFEPYRLTCINFVVFLTLLGVIVFSFKKKGTLLVVFLACVLAFILYKHIKKIAVLQLIMAVISLFTLLPVLSFVYNQNNEDWVIVDEKLLETKLKITPNIFVIQPDGYVNRSEIDKAPYSYDNSNFYDYLNGKEFHYYDDFRSNYYSTMTSNSSLFSMKHHYYSNTYSGTMKTFDANEIIIGKYNNVINLLKSNDYTTYLFTDNSFFYINRETSMYDFSNVKSSQVSYIDSGPVRRDIIDDFSTVLDTIGGSKNFFFIEKTIPGHITLNDRNANASQQREAYFKRLETSNIWLKTLIDRIEDYDKNALIILIADHGGFVGLNYTLEATERPMSALETKSAFSSMLSIKWPLELRNNDLEFTSSVNLFGTVFYGLSDDKEFLNLRQDDASYIPLYENGNSEIYKCIDENGKVVFEKLKSD